MGDPRKIRRKYEKTKLMWNRQRIDEEHGLKKKYGLKNLRELWKATTEIGKIRRNVREALAGRSKEGGKIIARLARYDIVKSGATLDDLLVVSPEAILERRLQSVVVRKGLAKTMNQSRQLITHGFISINGRRVSTPGYLVPKTEEGMIGYYKPIDLEHATKNAAGLLPGAIAQAAAVNAPAKAPGAKDE